MGMRMGEGTPAWDGSRDRSGNGNGDCTGNGNGDEKEEEESSEIHQIIIKAE